MKYLQRASANRKKNLCVKCKRNNILGLNSSIPNQLVNIKIYFSVSCAIFTKKNILDLYLKRI